MKIDKVNEYIVHEMPNEAISDQDVMGAFPGETVVSIHRTSENPRIYRVKTVLSIEGDPGLDAKDFETTTDKKTKKDKK